MLRIALAAVLFLALPAVAQEAGSSQDALYKALRCVHSAMTDPLLPVGLMSEQAAEAALARCYDEIELALASIVAEAPPTAFSAQRIALRSQLYEYALQVAGGTPGQNRYTVERHPG